MALFSFNVKAIREYSVYLKTFRGKIICSLYHTPMVHTLGGCGWRCLGGPGWCAFSAYTFTGQSRFCFPSQLLLTPRLRLGHKQTTLLYQ